MHEEKCMANKHPHTNNPNFEIIICIIRFNQAIALLNIKAVNDRIKITGELHFQAVMRCRTLK